MLPVSTGFIFSDGTCLETGGLGHRKCAYKYIMEHNLKEEYDKFKGGEDEFLIERLGAIKICHYCGNHYIYLPKVVGWYINEMRKLYQNNNFIVKYCYVQDSMKEYDERIFDTKGYSYNQTVIKDIDFDGNIIYKYNPLRIGD